MVCPSQWTLPGQRFLLDPPLLYSLVHPLRRLGEARVRSGGRRPRWPSFNRRPTHRRRSRVVRKEQLMAHDLTVTLEDRPGALADMGDALVRAGVNIDGISGTAVSGEVHILVEDAGAAKVGPHGRGHPGWRRQRSRESRLRGPPWRDGRDRKERVANAGASTSRWFTSPATGSSCWRRVTTLPSRRLHRTGSIAGRYAPVLRADALDLGETT